MIPERFSYELGRMKAIWEIAYELSIREERIVR